MNCNIFYRHFFHCLLLLVAIFICYSNTLQQGWHFDDIPNIVQNSNIRIQSLSWDEIKKTGYSSFDGKFSRPVARFSFALNYLYSGLDTTSYHVVNISIHIITAFFVYLVFLQTLMFFRKDESNLPGFISNQDIALLGAILWALHPIQTQAVTYLVQRMASMAAMFYMIAFYCYLKFRLQTAMKAKIVSAFFFFIFWMLALGSKQNAVLLPLALFGYEIAFLKFSLHRHRKFLFFALLLLVALFGCVMFFRGDDLLNSLIGKYAYRPYTMWERLLTQPVVLCKYLILLIIPLADFLTLDSDIVASSSLLDPPVTLLANIFVTLSFLLSIYWLKRFPVISFAFFFYFVNHLVESTFVNLELYFEHRNYLPSMFIYFGLSYYFIKIVQYYSLEGKKIINGFLLAAITAIIVSAGNATYLRNDVWDDDISLMADSIEKSPKAIRPYISIAVSYVNRGEYDKALEYLKSAEKLYKENPDHHQVNSVGLLYYNAAGIYLKDHDKKDTGKAFELLIKSYKIYPFDWGTNYNLGKLFFERDELLQAEEALANAGMLKEELKQDLSPDYYNMYGRVLYARGKFDMAEEAFQNGLAMRNSIPLQLNLVATLLQKGDVKQAQAALRKISRNDQNIAYLLYQSSFLSGPEREKSLERLAEALVRNGSDYCGWVTEIKKNKQAAIIYPDISTFEVLLRDKYLDKMAQVKTMYEENFTTVKNCSQVQLEISVPVADNYGSSL